MRVSINGVEIQASGRIITGRIVINDGHVIVDGQNVTPPEKEISIVAHGDVHILKADHCQTISVQGNAGSVETVSGDVACGAVHGSVKTMSGRVTCADVAGHASSMSGDVHCGRSGGASSMSGTVIRTE